MSSHISLAEGRGQVAARDAGRLHPVQETTRRGHQRRAGDAQRRPELERREDVAQQRIVGNRREHRCAIVRAEAARLFEPGGVLRKRTVAPKHAFRLSLRTRREGHICEIICGKRDRRGFRRVPLEQLIVRQRYTTAERGSFEVLEQFVGKRTVCCLNEGACVCRPETLEMPRRWIAPDRAA